MSAAYSKKSWRWIFIVSEAMVVGYLMLRVVKERFYSRVYLEPRALGISLGVLAGLAWLFLLVASPFFFRSLRGVALVGWFIALTIPLICVLLFH
jgi:hypothetical protein